MTQTQRCRYCGDFYRIDNDERAIETDDGWVSDIGFRQCQTEFHLAERALDEAWQLYYQQLDSENNNTEGNPQ